MGQERGTHKLTSAFKLKKLMLQGGGGAFNGVMLRAGFVDEISQVIVVVDGGGRDVTGVFDPPDDEAPKRSAALLHPVAHKTLPGGVH